MTTLGPEAAADLNDLADGMAGGLLDTAAEFCQRHQLPGPFVPNTASLILLEAITMRTLVALFRTDQARHDAIRAMHGALHECLRNADYMSCLVDPQPPPRYDA